LWKNHLSSVSWLTAPWFYAEAFCFRLILELVDFFHQGNDPFLVPKMDEWKTVSTWLHLTHTLEHSSNCRDELNPTSRREDRLMILLQSCLWGNKADGCFQDVRNGLLCESSVCEQEKDLLLVNDMPAVLEHLSSNESDGCIHFINDNSGTEMLMDLALADCLLTENWASNVIFNVKAFPTYVSDMTEKDIQIALEFMKEQDCPLIKQLLTRLQNHIQNNRLRFTSHEFWNSSHFFWSMPLEIREFLSDASLVIVKGDANYRRLLGDRHWPMTTSAYEAIPYFPQSFVALRTLKSDPIVGLTISQCNRLHEKDPLWRVNGHHGIIQSVLRPS